MNSLQLFLRERRAREADANVAILAGCYTSSHYRIEPEDYQQFLQLYVEHYHPEFCFHEVCRGRGRLYLDIDQSLTPEQAAETELWMQRRFSCRTVLLQKYDAGAWLPRYHVATDHVMDNVREGQAEAREALGLEIDLFPGMPLHCRMLGSIKKLNVRDRSRYFRPGTPSASLEDLRASSILTPPAPRTCAEPQ